MIATTAPMPIHDRPPPAIAVGDRLVEPGTARPRHLRPRCPRRRRPAHDGDAEGAEPEEQHPDDQEQGAIQRTIGVVHSSSSSAGRSMRTRVRTRGPAGRSCAPPRRPRPRRPCRADADAGAHGHVDGAMTDADGDAVAGEAGLLRGAGPARWRSHRCPRLPRPVHPRPGHVESRPGVMASTMKITPMRARTTLPAITSPAAVRWEAR